MNRPYVVSADIQALLQRWAKARGFILPGDEFFFQLREAFSSLIGALFREFVFIPERELKEGISGLARASGMAPVSLDRVYSDFSLHLDITRVVHDSWIGDGVLGPRADAPSLDEQFRRIKEAGHDEVVLVDDWVFTGALVQMVMSALSSQGVRVPCVIAGMVTGDALAHLRPSGVGVRSLYVFKELVDGVCERDFFPGVPLSGRLAAGPTHTRVPYILPFHPTGSWASIPGENRFAFSECCLRHTMRLFEAIEQSSSREVAYRDIGYQLFGVPSSLQGERYVDVLEHHVLRRRLRDMQTES